MDLYNLTPLAAGRFVFLDSTGLETLLVVVKATFTLQGGRVTMADVQQPLTLADEYRGEPERSSVRYASDLAPFKPATDVLLDGYAYPQGRSSTEVLVGFRLGKLTKAVRVIGDRVWDRTLGIALISSPRAFERMELTYERAYGGACPGGNAAAQPGGSGGASALAERASTTAGIRTRGAPLASACAACRDL